jgi:hypothetical protein
MKTIVLKNKIFSMMMLALITLSFVSCDKEDDVVKPTFKQELTGTWDISSYKLEGSEYIGVLVEKGQYHFFCLHRCERTISTRSYFFGRGVSNP